MILNCGCGLRLLIEILDWNCRLIIWIGIVDWDWDLRLWIEIVDWDLNRNCELSWDCGLWLWIEILNWDLELRFGIELPWISQPALGLQPFCTQQLINCIMGCRHHSQKSVGLTDAKNWIGLTDTKSWVGWQNFNELSSRIVQCNFLQDINLWWSSNQQLYMAVLWLTSDRRQASGSRTLTQN